MKVLWLSLLLCACGSPTASRVQSSQALEAYQDCVRAQAVRVGTRDSISNELADEVVAQCRHLLQAAASDRVTRAKGSPMTNLPAGMETEESRMLVALLDIEHEAKMLVSSDVPPLPVR